MLQRSRPGSPVVVRPSIGHDTMISPAKNSSLVSARVKRTKTFTSQAPVACSGSMVRQYPTRPSYLSRARWSTNSSQGGTGASHREPGGSGSRWPTERRLSDRRGPNQGRPNAGPRTAIGTRRQRVKTYVIVTVAVTSRLAGLMGTSATLEPPAASSAYMSLYIGTTGWSTLPSVIVITWPTLTP